MEEPRIWQRVLGCSEDDRSDSQLESAGQLRILRHPRADADERTGQRYNKHEGVENPTYLVEVGDAGVRCM